MGNEAPQRPTRQQRARALIGTILLQGVGQGRTVNGRLGPRGAGQPSQPRRQPQRPVSGGGYK